MKKGILFIVFALMAANMTAQDYKTVVKKDTCKVSVQGELKPANAQKSAKQKVKKLPKKIKAEKKAVVPMVPDCFKQNQAQDTLKVGK